MPRHLGEPRLSYQEYSEVPSLEHRRSHSLNYGNFANEGDRPNRVISGHRVLHRAVTAPRINFDSHATRIVKKLEEDKNLMQDTPVSEQLRREALRDLPQCLTLKRCVKQKLTKSVSQRGKSKPIGIFKRWKYRMDINFSKFASTVKNFNYFDLWHKTLKDIEGRFGSGYASYFKFLRWLFVTNFIIALFSFTLLAIPQIIKDTTSKDAHNTTGFQFKDLFTGEGAFTDSILYYGHYSNVTFHVISGLNFDMPAAYFSVTIILYLSSFVVFAVSVAQSYRRTFIETQGGLNNVYANRVFCGWDFAINKQEAAKLKSLAIYNELRELLSEETKNYGDRTCMFKFWTYSIQIVVNILFLVILAAVGWLTWILMDKYRSEGDQAVITAIVVNILIMIFPSIFNYISKYEEYKNPRTALYITLVRTYLLGAVIIGIILAYSLIKSSGIDCWESLLSAEIYRLTIFDFLFSVILASIIDIGYFVGFYFMGKDPKSEFNVARHTLQIIYNQGLFWVGFFYSPLLPAIVTIKMFIIFYIREFCVRKFCKPPHQTWRASQAQTVFKMMTFVSMIVILATHLYSFTSVSCSDTCGPFKTKNHTYDIVMDVVEDIKKHDVGRVIMNVTKPGGVALIMIGIMVYIYYVKEQASSNKEKVKMMRQVLSWVAKDKKWLVQYYNKVARGEISHFLGDPCTVQLHEYVNFDDDRSNIGGDEFNARFKKYS